MSLKDTRAKKLAVVSAYIEKPSQQTRDVQAPLSNVRNASVDNGFINSTSENELNVNGKGKINPVVTRENTCSQIKNSYGMGSVAVRVLDVYAVFLVKLFVTVVENEICTDHDEVEYVEDENIPAVCKPLCKVGLNKL